MKVDTHHHFWRYEPEEYGWITDDMAALRRDFLPEDLLREVRAAGIDGVVSVQARQDVEETEWLLGLAAAHDFIRGVVGWAPLLERDVWETLRAWAENPWLRGIRHVVQDEPEDDFILRPEFNRGMAELKTFGLVYDILIYERHLSQTVAFVDRHPDQLFVLDHIAKPRIEENVIEPWRSRMRELAEREHVYCKLSGVTEEADWQNWTDDQIRPYLETALEAFGPRRLMFGSNWPVCLVACDYGRWVKTVERFTGDLSTDEQAWVWGRTAVKAYGLKGPTT